MKRNEIERRVNEMVFDCYDEWYGTLDIELPLTDAIIATVTKEQFADPVCELYDGDTGEEPNLPNVCTFIERVAEECVKDIREQQEFEGYHDEPPVTLTRNELRWNHCGLNW